MHDGLKEELGWLKVLLVIVATIVASLVSWLTNNPLRPTVLYTVATAFVIAGSLWGVWMLRRGWTLIAELKRSTP